MSNTLELEKTILFGLVNNPNKINEIISIISPEDFIDETNKKIFQTIIELNKNNITPDFVTIITRFPEAKENLLEVLEYPILATSEKGLIEKAKLLKQEKIKREIQEIYIHNFDPDIIREKIAQLEAKGLSRWFTKEDIFAIIDQLFQTNNNYIIPYPFNLLNKATRGISKGQYIIVAGRPSIGKSTFLDNIAEYVANLGKKVLFASAEMSVEQITMRILSRIMKMNLFDMVNLSMIDKEKYEEAKKNFPSTLHAFSFTKVIELENIIKEKARDFDLVVVDYLQLLEPIKKYRNTYEKATYVSNELKSIATKFNIPIIVASQYSRVADRKQPMMSDLRDSGALEQDADVIISLWKSDDDSLEAVDGLDIVRVDLLKNRNGYTFINSDKKFFLFFKKNEFRFITPELSREL